MLKRSADLNISSLFVTFCLCLIFLTLSACSGDNGDSGDDSDGEYPSSSSTGSATFSLQWPSQFDCDEKDVTTVRVYIMPENGHSSVALESWPCSDPPKSIISNIPEGSNYDIYADGLDSYNHARFSGCLSGINIISGKTTDIGDIILEEIEATLGAEITSPKFDYEFRRGHYAAADMTINSGSSLNFKCEPYGGKLPLSFHWNFNGGAPDSFEKDPGDVTFSIPGSYPIFLEVTDANGNTTEFSSALFAPVIIVRQATQSTPTLPLSAAIISPKNNQTITVGQSVFFFGAVKGGSAPYAYEWNSNESPLSENQGINSSQYPEDIIFSTAGAYTVTFTVTDTNEGASSSDSVEIIVQD
jgi:hypothetical protein